LCSFKKIGERGQVFYRDFEEKHDIWQARALRTWKSSSSADTRTGRVWAFIKVLALPILRRNTGTLWRIFRFN